MKTKHIVTLLILVLSSTRLFAVQITDIGLPGDQESYATGISESGLVTGVSGGSHTFLYNGNTTQPVTGIVNPASINNSGWIAATSFNGGAPGFPALYISPGQITYFGGTNGLTFGQANAVNNLGQVVGVRGFSDGNNHAFFYNLNAILDLGCTPIAGSCYSSATAVNEVGQVVGYSNEGAFIYSGGVKTVIATPPGGHDGVAYGMNNHGDVVGTFWNGSAYRGFVYSAGVTTAILDNSSLNSFAADINDSGQVVGRMYLVPPTSCRTCNDYFYHAFIYQNGVLTDLNTFLPTGSGWVLSRAVAINNNHSVVGTGTHNGVQRAFLLQLDP